MSTALQRLRTATEDWVHDLGNVAVMLTISIPGHDPVRVLAGHADRERTENIRADHLYQIGSQTKTLTVLAGLVLEREGLLDRREPVASLLPDQGIDGRVTVEHLMMNTSGLGEFIEAMITPWFRGDIPFHAAELAAMGRAQGQIFTPGERFDYCNTGFVLLGLIYERITGKPYHRVLTEKVLHPLGMRNSHVGTSRNWPRERMARGYMVSRGTDGPLDVATAPVFDWAYGTGDVISSMDDMIRLARALLDPENPTGITLSRMMAVRARPARRPKFALSLGAEYALGIECVNWAGRPAWGHRGGTPGYGTGTWIDVDTGIVVTSCVTTVRDITEPAELQTLRYPGPQLFTLALGTAYMMAGL